MWSVLATMSVNKLEESVQLLREVAPRLTEPQLAQVVQLLQTWRSQNGFEEWQAKQRDRACLLEVFEITKALNSRQDLASLLALILDKAIEIAHAERGFIIMAPDGNIAVARNFDKEWVTGADLKISHSLAQATLSSGQAVITGNAQHDPKIPITGSIRHLALKSVLCLPLIAKAEILGVLYLDNRFCEGAFAAPSLPALKAFAEQAAIAVHHSQLLSALETRRIEMEKLLHSLDQEVASKTVEVAGMASELASKEETLSGCYRLGDMLSGSNYLREIFQIARRAALSDAPVLILGESGTGKGVLAQAIHNLGRRPGPFVAENCAAIAESLLESELFGYMRGAFTGATCDRKGLFSMANDGTLLLDEVGDMSLAMQAKLLRVLEDGAIRPVGSQKWQQVNVRIMAATHRQLEKMVEDKSFREDLWYRLRVITLRLPPLRQHPEDVPLLVKHFLAQQPEAVAKEICEVEPAAMEALMNYHWPGNVRQLEYEIRRLVALKGHGEKIKVGEIATDINRSEYLYIAPRLPLKEAVQRFEHNYITQTLRDLGGNKSEAARLLGVSRRSLYNKWSSDPWKSDPLAND